ncbi:MAG: winged helix-turn-helix transcriptional regulator [Litorimonas sp.]
MARDSRHCRSNCPINFVLETFGDKWTLLIIRDLMFKGKQTFGEFAESDESISTNILTDRLRRLEAHEIVEKSVSPDNRSKLIYALTPKGKDLLPIMLEITAWSARHDEKTNTPHTFMDMFHADKERLMRNILSDMD